MIRDYFVEVVRRGQRAGTIPAEADPREVCLALLSVVMGYLLQRALLGDLPAHDYIAATAAVLRESADVAAGV